MKGALSGFFLSSFFLFDFLQNVVGILGSYGSPASRCFGKDTARGTITHRKQDYRS